MKKNVVNKIGGILFWHFFYGHYRFHNLFLIFLYSLGEYPFSL